MHTLLDKIVTTNLRQQHRQCQYPVSTLPPLSIHSTQFPDIREPSGSSTNVCLRHRMFEYGTGLRNTSLRALRKKERQYVYGRFQTSKIFKEEMAQLTTCTMAGSFLAAGSLHGELRLFDINTGDIVAMHDSGQHSNSINSLLTCPLDRRGASGSPLLLSSSRAEVVLWDSGTIEAGGIKTFEHCRGGRFDPAGKRIVAIKQSDATRQLNIFDVSTGELATSFGLIQHGQRGYESTSRSVATFSPDNNLIVWGDMLWDSRVPICLHRFDQFSDHSSSCFHPGGNEVCRPVSHFVLA